MRTALTIDDDVLQAAKERARHEGTTAGTVISETFRVGWRATGCADGGDAPGEVDRRLIRRGIPILSRTGRIVTNDDVNRVRDELGS